MVTTYIQPENCEEICPVCGSAFDAKLSPRGRYVQCPKCREKLAFNAAAEAAGDAKLSLLPAPAERRLDMLEARVAALEAAVATAGLSEAAGEEAPQPVKLQWFNGAPDFSAEQGRILTHNLGAARRQAITIRAAEGDAMANTRGVWFKAVFELAGWDATGPVEVPSGVSGRTLSLAVPELPVGKDAAATYLALKAAGFEAVAVLDPDLVTVPGAKPRLSLTVPAERTK
jgi:hypothetical protein